MRPLPLIVIAYLMSASTMAAEYKTGSIEVINPWSRATPKGVSTAIGYMTIENTGTTLDRLIGGSVDVADRFELHSMVIENISRMRALPSIEIEPGQTIEFKLDASHGCLSVLRTR